MSVSDSLFYNKIKNGKSTIKAKVIPVDIKHQIGVYECTIVNKKLKKFAILKNNIEVDLELPKPGYPKYMSDVEEYIEYLKSDEVEKIHTGFYLIPIYVTINEAVNQNITDLTIISNKFVRDIISTINESELEDFNKVCDKFNINPNYHSILKELIKWIPNKFRRVKIKQKNVEISKRDIRNSIEKFEYTIAKQIRGYFVRPGIMKTEYYTVVDGDKCNCPYYYYYKSLGYGYIRCRHILYYKLNKQQHYHLGE